VPNDDELWAFDLSGRVFRLVGVSDFAGMAKMLSRILS
jgi:hypothetical protein